MFIKMEIVMNSEDVLYGIFSVVGLGILLGLGLVL